MEHWDEALLSAPATAIPNMRIYDWASDVKDDWFIEDGIHFTSPGYAARARLIAERAADRLPRLCTGRLGDATSSSCVIHPPDKLPPRQKAASSATLPATTRPRPPRLAEPRSALA